MFHAWVEPGPNCPDCAWLATYHETPHNGKDNDFLTVEMNDYYKGKMEGFCGDNDGKKNNDDDPAVVNCPNMLGVPGPLDQRCVDGKHQGN